MNKKTCVIFGLFLVVGVFVVLTGSVWALSLPDPTVDLPELGVPPASLHNDFYAYSLPILALDYSLGYGGGTGPGNPYYVNSTPGAIKDDIVIATGASGVPVNTNFPGMDNAYSTPSGVSGSAYFNTVTAMSPGGVADPGGSGEFAGDTENTWDTTLGALIGYLGRDDSDPSNNSPLVFFWNNNQTNSGDAQDQNLYGYGKVTISGPGKTPVVFYFSNGPRGVYNEFVGPADPGSFVLSPGQVVVDGYTINHNLGADQAAYALYSPGLDAGLENWFNQGYTTMQIDIRLRALNSGYEQLFIQRVDAVGVVPEPATLFLFGSGLLSMLGITGLRIKKVR